MLPGNFAPVPSAACRRALSGVPQLAFSFSRRRFISSHKNAAHTFYDAHTHPHTHKPIECVCATPSQHWPPTFGGSHVHTFGATFAVARLMRLQGTILRGPLPGEPLRHQPETSEATLPTLEPSATPVTSRKPWSCSVTRGALFSLRSSLQPTELPSTHGVPFNP